MKPPAVVPALLLVSCALAAASDGDWPGLRGPRYDGGAPGKLDATGGAGFAVAWRATLGTGYSSVAVASGRAVTLFSDGTNDVAAAFDSKSGRELWRSVIAPTLRGKDGSFDGPIATPALAGDRVFGLGRGATCSRSTPRQAACCGRWISSSARRVPYLTIGFSSTPLVAGGVLVVQLGSKPGALAGFDPATGARRWRVGDGSVAYQSPVVVSVGARRAGGRGQRHETGGDRPAERATAARARSRRRAAPIGAESIVPVPAGDGRVFLKSTGGRDDDAAPGARGRRAAGGNAVDRAGAARDLRDSRLPRRLPLRHERARHAHLRRRRDRRPALALARAGRRLPVAGRATTSSCSPRRARCTWARRAPKAGRSAPGSSCSTTSCGRPRASRKVPCSRAARESSRASSGASRKASAPRRLRRRLAPPRGSSRASSTSLPPRRTSPRPSTVSSPRFPLARSSSGRTGWSSCIAERRPTRASPAT